MVAGYEMTRRCVNLNEVERKISQEKFGTGLKSTLYVHEVINSNYHLLSSY